MSISIGEEPTAVQTTGIASPIRNPTPFTAEEKGLTNDVLPLQIALTRLAEEAQQTYDRAARAHSENNDQTVIQREAVNRLAGIRFLRAVYQRGVDSCPHETDPAAWDKAGMDEVEATLKRIEKKRFTKADALLIDTIYEKTFHLIYPRSLLEPVDALRTKKKEQIKYWANLTSGMATSAGIVLGGTYALAGDSGQQLPGLAVAALSGIIREWNSRQCNASEKELRSDRERYNNAEITLNPVVDAIGCIVNDTHFVLARQTAPAR